MAIDYTNLPLQLGAIIAEITRLDGVQSDCLIVGQNYGADYVLNKYEAANRNDLTVGVYARYQGFASQVRGWETALLSLANATIIDLATSLNCSPSVSVVLPLLYKDMVANTKRVQLNAVAAGSPSAWGSNTGNGNIVTSITDVNSVTNEHIVADTIMIRCVADKNTNGATSLDRFSMDGSGTVASTSYATKKARLGGSLTMAEASTILLNGSFEDFTVTNTPDNWTIDNGTVTTNILEETSAVFITGTSALFLKSDATAATIKLHQNITGVLGTKYAIQVQLKKTGGSFSSTSSRLAITVKGTGISTVDVFASADPGTALTTSYVKYSAVVNLPTVVPSDLNVEIAWTVANGVTSGQGVYVDQITMSPMVEFNHVWYALFRGSTDFLVNDYFTLANTNDYAGKFQTFFARFYDAILPSTASGTPPEWTNAMATFAHAAYT